MASDSSGSPQEKPQHPRPRAHSKGLHVRCPHCKNPIEVAIDDELKEIECISCGSQFSLIAGQSTVGYQADTKTLGHFKLLEKVGVGAFGTVWKAKDTELDRTVAVKIPRASQLEPEEIEKFLREARAAAQVRHANIVSVHEVGREDESVYIVSDFVEGATLDEWLLIQTLTPREAAELCRLVAEALHEAHESGVVHRDLKPGNIMIGLDSRPYITDFGLAKRETGEITITEDGRVVGTPAYMSPEQASGKGHFADRRADVYSLGVILYRLLTGQLPFQGDSRMLVVQILREDPAPPRGINRRTPKDMETICIKCLEKDPSARYQTARELAEDLGRFLNGEPILARRISSLQRVSRWVKRNPTFAALFAGLFLVLLAGIGIGTAIAFAMDRGMLEFRHNDEQVRILVEKNGVQVAVVDTKERSHVRLPSGDYELSLIEPTGEFSLGSDQVTVSRGEKEAVQVTRLRPHRNPWPHLPPDAPFPAIAPFETTEAKERQQAWAEYLRKPIDIPLELPGGEILTLMLVPPGEFMMGSTEEDRARFLEAAESGNDRFGIARIPKEVQHQVRITQPFYLGKYEVTQAQWEAVMGNIPSLFEVDASHPVDKVTWEDTQQFLARIETICTEYGMKFVLPTEAQWEYACRAGTTTAYCFGDNTDVLWQYARCQENSQYAPHPVGKRYPNGWGLYDMHGNVHEWCSDWYYEDYYAESPLDDPAGPEEGEKRVYRGGCARSTALRCRSAHRDAYKPLSRRGVALGFRVAACLVNK